MIEQFRCTPFNARLKRSECGKRHTRARREGRHEGTQGQAHLVGGKVCASCVVGEAHARGEQPTEWPDGTLIEVSSIVPGSRSERRSEPSTSTPPMLGARSVSRAAKPTDCHVADSAVPAVRFAQRSTGEDASAARRASGARAAERSAAVEATARPAVESEPARSDAGLALHSEDAMQSSDRACNECGKGYTPNHPRQLYCGSQCRERAKYYRETGKSPPGPQTHEPRAIDPQTAEDFRRMAVEGGATMVDSRVAGPAAESSKRTNGQAIVERLETVFRGDGSGRVEPAAAVLEAAGFRVLSKVRAPNGIMLVVSES